MALYPKEGGFMIAEYASSFATIVGLASAFASGRTASKSDEVQDFIRWLIEHNHEEACRYLEKNQAATKLIADFLKNQIPQIHEKLDAINLLLLQMIEEREGSSLDSSRALGNQYGKRSITIFFERLKGGEYLNAEFDAVLNHVKELLHGHMQSVDIYVLDAMVREILTSKVSAHDVVNRHWDNLIR